MIQLIILHALFASTFSLGKVLLQYATPIFLVGIRMGIAGSLLLAYHYFSTGSMGTIRFKHWRLYAQAVLFTCYLPYILRFWGLQHMSPSKASLLYTAGPFVTFLLSYFLADEKVTTKKVVGLLVGFIGLLPMLIKPEPTENLLGGFGFFSMAEFYVIASISCLSYGWIITHKLLKEYKYPPTLANGISMFAGGILALFTSAIFETPQPITDMKSFLMILAIVVIVSNLICHTMYGMLLRKYSPTFMSFAGFMTPLFAAFYEWLLLDAAISRQFFVSVVCVFIGLGIFYYDSFAHPRKTLTPSEQIDTAEEMEW
ncbi:MAG: DMT family transporter [Candidatus Babeliales bacterium]